MFWTGFYLGLIIGTLAGLIIAALLGANHAKQQSDNSLYEAAKNGPGHEIR